MNISRRALGLLVLGAGGLLLAAPVRSQEQAPNRREFTIVARDFKFSPTRLEVTCRIVMDEVEGKGHQIVASHVTVAGDDVPDDVLERADAGCPFSTLLRNAGVSVEIVRA